MTLTVIQLLFVWDFKYTSAKVFLITSKRNPHFKNGDSHSALHSQTINLHFPIAAEVHSSMSCQFAF